MREDRLYKLVWFESPTEFKDDEGGKVISMGTWEPCDDIAEFLVEKGFENECMEILAIHPDDLPACVRYVERGEAK